MLVKTNTFARKCIIYIGKYTPFLVVALVTFANLETFYAWLFDRYIEIDSTTIYYKPISWWIGHYFELSSFWLVLFVVLSFGVEACVWNKICIVSLTISLAEKHYFAHHSINETHFICIVLINIIIGVILVHKGLRIFAKSKCKNK